MPRLARTRMLASRRCVGRVLRWIFGQSSFVAILRWWRRAVMHEVLAPLQVCPAYERVAVERRLVEDRFGLQCLGALIEIADAPQDVAHRHVGDITDRRRVRANYPAA